MATVGPGAVLPTAGVRVAGNVYDPYGLPPRPASTTPYSLGVAPAYPAYSHSAYSVPSVPVTPYGTPYGASVGMAYGAATVAPTVQYTTPAIASTSYGYYPSSMQYAPTYWQPAAVAGPGAILRYSPSAGERFAGGMEKFVGHMTGDPLLVAHGQQKQVHRSAPSYVICLTLCLTN